MSQTLAPIETPRTLRVDFSWRKLRFLVLDSQTKPCIIVKISPGGKLEFVEADTHLIIGTSKIYTLSIHPDFTIGARSLQLKAQKHFAAEYSFLSYAYSDTEEPVVMTWTSNTSLSKWDIVLLNEQREAVARYSTNLWALKKIGTIEFVGPKAESKAVRDEVVVTVCTLYNTMSGKWFEILVVILTNGFCFVVRIGTFPISPIAAAFADVKPIKGQDEPAKDV